MQRFSPRYQGTGFYPTDARHRCLPAMPSDRYATVAPKVREVCERYDLPDTSGSLPRQYAQVRTARRKAPAVDGGNMVVANARSVQWLDEVDREVPRSRRRRALQQNTVCCVDALVTARLAPGDAEE